MTNAEGVALAADVLAAIAEVGVSATFNDNAMTYDESTGITTTVTTQYAVTTSPPVRISKALVDGVTFTVTDLSIYLGASGLAFTPAIGDSITVEGSTYNIIELLPVYNIGGGVVLWEFVCRR